MLTYRVVGTTKPRAVWEWYEGVCGNQERCWGPSISIRHWTVFKAGATEWVFRTTISNEEETNRRSIIDEFRVKLTQGNGRNRLEYSGVGTARQCNSFWPMVPGEKPICRKILVKMRSGEPLPPDPNIAMRFDPKHIFANVL